MASQPPPQGSPQDAMDVDDTTPTATSSNSQQPRPVAAAEQSTRQSSREPPPDGEEHNDDEEEAGSASPPLPEKHTAVTPGPRATRLQELFASTLKHTLDKINRDNFAACYPTVAQRAPGTLEFVQRQMVGRLGQQCDKEFDSILQNRNVVAKLNELESLVSEAARRKAELRGSPDVESPIPPHTLPAETILAAHLAPHLASQQSQLNAKLQTVQSHNSRLFDEIQAQRAEMERILVAVEEALADVGGANELLDGVVEDLGKETRAVEVEMSGTT